LRGTTSSDVGLHITRENRFRGLWAVDRWKNPKKEATFDAQFRAYGEKKPIEGS